MIDPFPASHGGNFPAGGYGADDDLRDAHEHASRHAGDSADSSLFSTLLGTLQQKKASLAQEDIDEEGALYIHSARAGQRRSLEWMLRP